MLETLEHICLALPEAQRVDIAAWDDQPSFRVRGKNFAFSDVAGSRVTVKLPADEAQWVCQNVSGAAPARYGLGTHGWVVIPLPQDAEQLRQWVLESYRLVAPRSLSTKMNGV